MMGYTRPRDFADRERYGSNDRTWLALQRFIGRPWFRRVGIVQECTLARNYSYFRGRNGVCPLKPFGYPLRSFSRWGFR